MNKSFETLVESFNAQLQVFINNGYAIYDAENPNYYISKIKFCKEDDQLKFEIEEDK